MSVSVSAMHIFLAVPQPPGLQRTPQSGRVCLRDSFLLLWRPHGPHRKHQAGTCPELQPLNVELFSLHWALCRYLCTFGELHTYLLKTFPSSLVQADIAMWVWVLSNMALPIPGNLITNSPFFNVCISDVGDWQGGNILIEVRTFTGKAWYIFMDWDR